MYFNNALLVSTQSKVFSDEQKMCEKVACKEDKHYKRQTILIVWEEGIHPQQNAYF